MPKKIIITGASGLIGKKITQELLFRGYNVMAITRNVQKTKNLLPASVEFFEWDFNKPTKGLVNLLDGAKGVIHLAGENVLSKRWTEKHKQNIYNSRVNSTKTIADAILNTLVKPELFITASAVGYYGLTTKEPADEHSKCGDDFLARLTKDWEDASAGLEKAGVRRVCVRTGIVLDKKEGALAKMITPYKFFLGGPLGNGKQYFPWIHINDIAGLFLFTLENNSLSGAYNAVAPETITMKEFCSVLGKKIKRPSLLNVPAFALKLLYGQGAEILLNGVNIIPKRTLECGFKFKFQTAEEALNNLL